MTFTLESKENLIKDIWQFNLKSTAPHKYSPGQCFILTIDGDKRTFGYITSPHEEKISFVTKIRKSAFKEKLINLKLNSELNISGPFGIFTLRENEECVMISSNIGIVPMRSMAMHAAENKFKTKITILYLNKNPSDAIFMHDLEVCAARNKNIKFFCIDGRDDLKAEDLKEYINGTENKVFYISGFPGFVGNATKILMNSKIPPNKIITQSFTGY